MEARQNQPFFLCENSTAWSQEILDHFCVILPRQQQHDSREHRVCAKLRCFLAKAQRDHWVDFRGLSRLWVQVRHCLAWWQANQRRAVQSLGMRPRFVFKLQACWPLKWMPEYYIDVIKCLVHLLPHFKAVLCSQRTGTCNVTLGASYLQTVTLLFKCSFVYAMFQVSEAVDVLAGVSWQVYIDDVPTSMEDQLKCLMVGSTERVFLKFLSFVLY